MSDGRFLQNIPAVITALSEENELNSVEEINALITAGTIGYIISAKVAMSGAAAGCQTEWGLQ